MNFAESAEIVGTRLAVGAGLGAPLAATLPYVQRLAGYGEAIRRLRERAGLNQSQLAKRARIGLRTLQRCESEEGFPALDTVDALLVALGIGLADLARELDAQRDGHVAESSAAYGPPAAVVEVVEAAHPALSRDETFELARALAAAVLRAKEFDDLAARIERLERSAKEGKD